MFKEEVGTSMYSFALKIFHQDRKRSYFITFMSALHLLIAGRKISLRSRFEHGMIDSMRLISIPILKLLKYGK